MEIFGSSSGSNFRSNFRSDFGRLRATRRAFVLFSDEHWQFLGSTLGITRAECRFCRDSWVNRIPGIGGGPAGWRRRVVADHEWVAPDAPAVPHLLSHASELFRLSDTYRNCRAIWKRASASCLWVLGAMTPWRVTTFTDVRAQEL